MFGIGIPELLVVLVIVLILFGGKKLPELSRSIGEAIRELRRGIVGDDSTKISTPKKAQEKK